MSFKDEEDALQLANATEYCLVSGIWTENGGRQARVAKRMQSGQVFINCYGAGGGVEDGPDCGVEHGPGGGIEHSPSGGAGDTRCGGVDDSAGRWVDDSPSSGIDDGAGGGA